MRKFDVRVKYKGRPYGSSESIRADSMTIEDANHCFWLHSMDASGNEIREMTASFPVADVESVRESNAPVSDAAVIRRVVEVIVVFIVEKAKMDGEPLSEEEEKREHTEWTDKLKKVFGAVRAGGSVVRELLATGNQIWTLLR